MYLNSSIWNLNSQPLFVFFPPKISCFLKTIGKKFGISCLCLCVCSTTLSTAFWAAKGPDKYWVRPEARTGSHSPICSSCSCKMWLVEGLLNCSVKLRASEESCCSRTLKNGFLSLIYYKRTQSLFWLWCQGYWSILTGPFCVELSCSSCVCLVFFLASCSSLKTRQLWVI